MTHDNVLFKQEARDLIIEGVDLATRAIATTYGPNGQNVLIKTGENIKSTKDGATVIQAVNSPNPYVQMGINVIREASVKTAKTVGDGSTTVAILADSIVKVCKDHPAPVQVARNLRRLSDGVIKFLESKKRIIKTKKDLTKVATLAANNDSAIGELIAEAFSHVGKDGIVTFKESEEVKDRIEYSEGFRIENGYESPYFINTTKNECVLENAIVYISDVKLEESKEIHELAGKAYKEGKSLLLIAPEFDSGLTMFLIRNLFNSDGTPRLKSCMVISPNFGAFREAMLEDMRIILGDSTCNKVVITKESTTFSGYKPNQEKLQGRIEAVRKIIDAGELPEQELDFHKKRLANFTSGIATIFVGGYSKVEMKERYDRFEDAIMATQCALIGGVLPGGGTALALAAEETPSALFAEILRTPINLLNTQIKTQEEAYARGVIEPFLVVKATIENSVAVASTILTTNCAILNV